MKKLISVILIISNIALADGQVVPINKGDIAKFDGFLIDQDKALSIKNQAIDLSLANRTNEILNQQNALMNSQLDLANKQINSLSEQVVKERDSFPSKVTTFLLGCVVTTAVAFGVSRAIR